MTDQSLVFKEAKKEDDIVALSNFDMQAFTDSIGFKWTQEFLRQDIKSGWKIYSVKYGEEIVAAVSMRAEKDALFTKNTPIKMSFQGNGFSHMIKEFYEGEAQKQKVKKVVNYCPVDNFRMIALNESHGYKKTGKFLGQNQSILEWEKVL